MTGFWIGLGLGIIVGMPSGILAFLYIAIKHEADNGWQE